MREARPLWYGLSVLRILVALSLVGCTPSFAWEVQSDCEDEEVLYGIAIEGGDCGSVSGEVLFSQDLSAGDAMAPPVAALEPSTYCFESFAYRADRRVSARSNGFDCRFDALVRETRSLPSERSPIEAALSCAEPPAVATETDALLASVAGCCPTCDVERCVCSAACDIDRVDAGCASACPSPARVRNLVATDHYVCGLAQDRSGLVCWGDGLGGPPSLRAAMAEAPGVALTFSALALSAETEGLTERDFAIENFDAEGDTLCFSTREDLVCVDDFARPVRDGSRQLAVSASRVFVGGAGARRVIDADAVQELTFSVGTGLTNFVGLEGRLCVLSGLDLVCAGVDMRTCREGCLPFTACGCTIDVDPGCRMTPCRPQDILKAVDITAGWGVGCAIAADRTVACWTLDEEFLAPLQTEDGEHVVALEVTVGEHHVCIVTPSEGVQCGLLERRDGAFSLVATRPFDVGIIDELEAGPDGVTCAIRSEDGTVVCEQLAEFQEEASSPLRGVGNTSTLPEARPVCP